MRRIINATFTSLDGVIENPQDWPAGEPDPHAVTVQTDLLMACDAVLLGRHTYEAFAAAWPAMAGDPYSDRMNSMTKYVVSSKRKIKAAGIPFRVPPDHLLRDRLDAVLAVVYLIFNEGYGGRDELAAEAIWLGRALTELLPDDPEVRGLLAMMLMHDSRRETRFNDGELVLLADQDPARWNTTQIERGRAELDRAIALGGRGPYVLQAAIASLHAQTPCDWAQIAALYSELARLTASPVVELNRAIAVAETDGPQAGLRLVDGLGLDDFRYLHATRAELLRRLGRTDEARDAYRRARQLTDDGAERRFLDRRLTELAGEPRVGLPRHEPGGDAAGGVVD